MRKLWMTVNALLLLLFLLFESFLMKSARADIHCSDLASCSGAAGCAGPGSVSGCTITCDEGGQIRCLSS